MSDLRTFGQLLDDYLADTYTVESVYLYHDKDAQPHIIVTTSESSWDYTEVFSEHHDLTQEVSALKKQVKVLESQIRGLETDKRQVEGAIKKLVKHGAKA